MFIICTLAAIELSTKIPHLQFSQNKVYPGNQLYFCRVVIVEKLLTLSSLKRTMEGLFFSSSFWNTFLFSGSQMPLILSCMKLTLIIGMGDIVGANYW